MGVGSGLAPGRLRSAAHGFQSTGHPGIRVDRDPSAPGADGERRLDVEEGSIIPYGERDAV